MGIRVVTTAKGSMGARPGGLQLVIGPLIAAGPGEAFRVVAQMPPNPLPYIKDTHPATRPGTPESESLDPYEKIGNSIAEAYDRWLQGKQVKPSNQAWWEFVRDQMLRSSRYNRTIYPDEGSGGGGPQVEVRPQWFADP